MTVNEFIGFLIPLLSVSFNYWHCIWCAINRNCITNKKILERVETMSDVSGWLSLIRKWPSRKNNQ